MPGFLSQHTFAAVVCRQILRALMPLFGGIACALTPSQAGEPDRVLEEKRLHLGKPGQWEWEHYRQLPVDSEQFEVRFLAARNESEQTLRLWHRDVKLTWPVLLNGRKIGTLTTLETAMETILAIPPGVLRDGENLLTVLAPQSLDDIEIGPVILSAASVRETLGGAELDVSVVDGSIGTGIPSRLTLTRPDGTLQPLRAEPDEEVATRVGVVYTKQGRAALSVPPGEYVLYAGRGFEWGVAQVRLSLKRGERRAVRLQIRREVPTAGWIAADSHIHTFTHSKHGDAKVEERMLTIAGEGIELAVATDHNHLTDYARVAASVGVADRFTSVIGNEVTTKAGHFNAFPVTAGTNPANHLQEDWARLLPDVRAMPGVKIVTLNHPRDLHSGFIPFGETQFDPLTGRHEKAAALDVDAIEVVTSAAMQSDVELLFRDWFALLNRGHKFSAIASSDTHDVSRFILGQGRTYVAAKDSDPARIDLDEVWRSYKSGRLLVSFGLMAQLTVDGRFGVGDLVRAGGETIAVEARVLGPAWTTADRVALYANGVLLREQSIDDKGLAGEKARVRWDIPRPPHDVYLVVLASGPGVSAPFWETPRPYQPSDKMLRPRVLGATNPVWIDADGDGRFQCAYELATDLLKRAGGDVARIEKELGACDAAVAAQVRSLLKGGGK